MKKLFAAILAMSAIFAFNSCRREDPVIVEDEGNNGPVVTWTSNPNFDVLDITGELDANITVTAAAGISSFVVTVDSEVLEETLYYIGVETAELDLINDDTVIQILDAVTEGQLPTGSALAGQTEVNVDISSLVLMINELTTEDSYHSFTLDVIDTEGESAQATCTFHRVGEDDSDDDSDDDPDEDPVYAEPTITWEGNEDFSTMELQEEMSVNIIINVPAGIESLVVDVNSAQLNNMGISSIDFVNPGNMSDIVNMVLGAQDIATAVELNLDLSTLVPMILLLEPEDDSYHVFTLNLTDNLGRTLNKSLTFHYTDASVVLSMSNVDLWKNTAVLKVSGPHESVAYRVASTGEWITLTGTDGTYNISPVWSSSTNDANLTVYTPKEGYGIFAGNTYEFMIDDEVVEYTYTAGAGDAIPNGDMSSWSTKSGSLPYPNAEGDSFWDSGNNSLISSKLTLCQEAADEPGVAHLQAGYVTFLVFFGSFSPGNMYTGDFSMSGTTGYASMGKQYSWTARPKAFKFDYKASVGTIDYTGSNDPEASSYSGQQDIVIVYAAVVDWSEQHVVTSGLSAPTGIWDPAAQTSVDEGKILGYASFETSESNTGAFTAVEIPFEWYDNESRPADGNYTIVISCTTSKRGDYLTGCSTNYMRVDNFEWVY